jgi:hypothetical protein
MLNGPWRLKHTESSPKLEVNWIIPNDGDELNHPWYWMKKTVIVIMETDLTMPDDWDKVNRPCWWKKLEPRWWRQTETDVLMKINRIIQGDADKDRGVPDPFRYHVALHLYWLESQIYSYEDSNATDIFRTDRPAVRFELHVKQRSFIPVRTKLTFYWQVLMHSSSTNGWTDNLLITLKGKCRSVNISFVCTQSGLLCITSVSEASFYVNTVFPRFLQNSR